VDLTVVDVTGRVVLSARTGRMQHTLDLGAEPAGVYLLTVRTEAGVTSRRIVRQ
jgi:hypothetical protein